MLQNSTCKFFVFAFLLFLTNTICAQVNKTDSLALVDLYNNTNGNNWNRKANWLTSASLSSWEGITVQNRRVTNISLAQNGLKGRLPTSFGNIDSLISLSLNENDLQGGFPASFGKLVHLVYLSLSDNLNFNARLTPAIGNLVSLQTIRLHATGTKGNLPKEIGQLSALNYIDISNCSLTGSLPNSFGKLSQLSTLILSNNNMSGALPASFGNISGLTYLDISHNRLNGSLPSSGNLPLLKTLLLNNNEFSGSFPGWFSKAASLYTINIAYNQFTGKLPDELNNIVSLYSLTASYNHFSGPIPDWAFNKYFLFDVFLDHNDFSQPENKCVKLGNTTDYLNISYNHYTFNGLECIFADNFFFFIAPQSQIAIHSYKNGLAVSAGGTLKNNTYTWFKVDASGKRVITGDSTFNPKESGMYYAKVTNSSVPTLTLVTDTVVYNKPTLTQSFSITVYPNPGKNIVRIDGLNNNATTKISVTDLAGRQWITKTSSKQTFTMMDISRLKAGSYMLTATDGKESKTISLLKE